MSANFARLPPIKMLLLLLAAMPALASSELAAWMESNRVSAAFMSIGPGPSRLTCLATQKASGDGTVLRIESLAAAKPKTLLELDPGLSLVCLCPLGDSHKEILSVWSGGSSYHIWIVGVQGEKAEILLEAPSKLFPEVLYSKDSKLPLVITSDTRGQPAEPGTWRASLYAAGKGKYVRRREGPYLKRLRDLQ
jgi:hypothetical protein